jgi:hypothetical protein
MGKYICQFKTTIRGELTIDAPSIEDADAMAEDMAADTLSYEDLTSGGKYVPDVETEFENIYEQDTAA